MQVISVERVFDSQSLLAETPLWHAGQQALYWVNIVAGEVHRFVPGTGEHRCWTQGFCCAGLAETPIRDELLVLSQEGVLTLNTATGAWRRVREPLWPFDAMIRPNEAKVGPDGRLWAASLHMGESDFLGQLVTFAGTDQPVQRLGQSFCIPNTLAWSPDGRFFYCADSTRQTLWRYPYDQVTARLGEPEPFFSVAGEAGTIDGSAMDSEGCLWTCLWGQVRLVRISPQGRIIGEIPMPVLNPTSCCFGGPDMTTLYITSARKNVAAHQLPLYPDSGAIWCLDAGVEGMPVPAFAGSLASV